MRHIKQVNQSHREEPVKADPERHDNSQPDAALLYGRSVKAPACPCDGGCDRCNGIQNKSNPKGLEEAADRHAQEVIDHDIPVTVPSDVRLHHDHQASRITEKYNARALTKGRDIYFNRGEYNTTTRAGKKILAHELIHAEQQRLPANNRFMLRKKKKTPKASYYADIELNVEAMADKISSTGWYAVEPSKYEMWQALLKLCKAEETNNEKAIKKAVARLSSTLTVDYNSKELVRDVAYGLVIKKLYVKGYFDAAVKLREQYKKVLFNIQDEKGDKSAFLLGLGKAVAEACPVSAADATKVLPVFLHYLEWLQTEKKEIPDIQTSLRSDSPVRYSTLSGDLYAELNGMILDVHLHIEKALQILQDNAVKELQEEGRSPALVLMKDMLKKIDKILNIDQRTRGLTVVITKTDYAQKKMKDRFDDKRAGFKFSFFDQDRIMPKERQIPLHYVIEIRKKQVAVLYKMYVVDRALLPEHMELHNADDWQELLLNKYDAEVDKTGNKTEALLATIDYFEKYLKAFTTSPVFNLIDSGGSSKNYITREFPRALTGQLIHDCGVYALRIVYMLSKVRDKLGLNIEYIIMPNHVGLIISGENLPLILVHNNDFNIISRKDLEGIQKKWEQYNNPGGAVPFDGTQFYGELSVAYFYGEGVDTPFIVEKAADSGSARQYKAKLWKDYKELAARQLFKDVKKGEKGYQFHLRYLQIMEVEKIYHNTKLWPAWHVKLPALWKTFSAGMTPESRKTYVKESEKIIAGLKAGIAGMETNKKNISEEYYNNPLIHGSDKGIHIAQGARIAEIYTYPLINELTGHIEAVNAIGDFSQPGELKKILIPPFQVKKFGLME